MEIKHLRHFLAVYESRSYWRAAELFGLTPQALSKSIRRFEESLGVRLFDRDTRSVRPTLFADEIALYARNIDAESTSLRRKLDSLLGTGANQLAIGTGAAAATTLIGQAMSAVIHQRPKLAVSVVEGTYESLIPQLIRGKLDVVVSIMTSGSVDRLIEFRQLKVEHYRAFARAGHPLAGQKRVQLAMLLEYPWIAGDDEDLVADEVAASFAAVGLKPRAPSLRTNSVLFASSLMLQSDALLVLPDEMMRRECATGLAVAIDIDCATWTRPTMAFFRKNSTVSPDTKFFLRELKRIVEAGAPLSGTTGNARLAI
jgi:LysR family transcriptional regulator of gallate degradation